VKMVSKRSYYELAYLGFCTIRPTAALRPEKAETVRIMRTIDKRLDHCVVLPHPDKIYEPRQETIVIGQYSRCGTRIQTSETIEPSTLPLCIGARAPSYHEQHITSPSAAEPNRISPSLRRRSSCLWRWRRQSAGRLRRRTSAERMRRGHRRSTSEARRRHREVRRRRSAGRKTHRRRHEERRRSHHSHRAGDRRQVLRVVDTNIVLVLFTAIVLLASLERVVRQEAVAEVAIVLGHAADTATTKAE
jgi:hypothetical protein